MHESLLKQWYSPQLLLPSPPHLSHTVLRSLCQQALTLSHHPIILEIFNNIGWNY